jgi:hypothetical protein
MGMVPVQIRCGLFAVLLSTSAWAAPRPYQLRLTGSPDCGGSAALQRELSLRGSDLVQRATGPVVAIHVGRFEGHGAETYTAQATLPDGTLREVQAPECGDVVAALAFIILVALEPAGDVDDARAVVAPSAAPPTLTNQSLPLPWQSSVGVSGGLNGGRARSSMPLAALYFERWREGARWLRGGRVTALYGAAPFVSPSEPVAVRFGGALAELCPLGKGPVSLCGGIEAGATRLRSSPQLSSLTTWRRSLASRWGVRGSWMASKRLVLDLNVGAWLPLTLDTWVVERADGTRAAVHRVVPSAYGALSFGFRL